ncbi:hypothetical protein [Flavihumibacter solisilvae]|uniref:Uncharacterized protein n=1 Tax=Flavihumibacter solisilvae TaxID=1349421 RepID=A0A0C1IEV2_9BACT|nr:hypothetical protein [Flavihumibacter solisilvae]KIC92700.1 hypothetical protein OI18_21520 [Flavihumibacter solisilvae]
MPSFTQRNRVFPTGEELPGGFYLDNIDPGYSFIPKMTVTAESSPGEYKLYNKFFKNIIGVYPSTFNDFPTVLQEFHLNHVIATVWYVDPLTFKPPQSQTQIFVFDTNIDEVVAGSPIESVTPAGAWPGDGSVIIDTSAGDVEIIARINVEELPGSEFLRWRTYKSGDYGPLPDETLVTIPQYMSDLVVAAYTSKNIFKPNFNVGRFIEQLNKFKDLIDQVVDPAPEEWVRLKEMLGVDDGTYANNEDLLDAIRNTDLKDADALRVKLAEVESRRARLLAADKLIAETLAKLDNRKR